MKEIIIEIGTLIKRNEETLQAILLCIGVVAITFFLSDCAKSFDDNTEKRRMHDITESKKVESMRASKIDSLSAKCKVHYE